MKKSRFSTRNVAISVSLAFHAVLFVVLLIWYVPRPGGSPVSTVKSVSPDADGSKETGDRPPPSPPSDLLPTELTPDDLVADEINDSIESQIEQSERLTVEQKQSELEKNLKRLDSLADKESVDAVSATIANTLGLDSEQYEDSKAPADGPLDTESAQIMDVRKSQSDDGRVQYETRMVDSAGREMWVPMNQVEGEQLYETFETMKKFPMAKGIYQSVVMPMMQKMLESESRRPSKPTVISPAKNEGSTDPKRSS